MALLAVGGGGSRPSSSPVSAGCSNGWTFLPSLPGTPRPVTANMCVPDQPSSRLLGARRRPYPHARQTSHCSGASCAVSCAASPAPPAASPAPPPAASACSSRTRSRGPGGRGSDAERPTSSPSGAAPSTAGGGSQAGGRSSSRGIKPDDRHSKVFRIWRDERDSKAIRLVRCWWTPIEASVQERRPKTLDAAVKASHGAPYLKAIKAVRRSQSLKAAERHALEVEMAARLVSARALLERWQVGLQEIRAARAARDPQALAAALDRWDFATDEELTEARIDLLRWERLAASLPGVLREAVEARDIEQLREAVGELTGSGPAHVEGAEAARALLERYDQQARALDDAVSTGRAKDMQAALACWEFERDDVHVLRVRGAFERREQGKAALRAAVAAMDGTRLREAIDAWEFEPADEDFAAARTAHQHYAQSVAELERLVRRQSGGDILGIAAALAAWTFSDTDPALAPARAALSDYEASVRRAVEARDGLALQRLWCAGGSGRALAACPDLRERTASLLHGHDQASADLRLAFHVAAAAGASASSPKGQALQRLLDEWEFSPSDPLAVASRAFLRARTAADERHLRNLRAATASGNAAAIAGALRQAAAAALPEDCAEVTAAREAHAAFEAALTSTGVLALGAETPHVRVAAARNRALEAGAAAVRRAVAAIDAKAFVEIKALSKPTSILHAIFEFLMHVLAGIDRSIEDPPRDTEWRSCQRMVSGVPAFLAHLEAVPDWLSSGHLAGMLRAVEVDARMRFQFGELWGAEHLRIQDACGTHLLKYIEALMSFWQLLPSREATTPEGGPDGAAAGGSCCSGDFSRLRRAVPHLGGSSLLASAWVVGGGAVAELSDCRERLRRLAASARSATAMAEAALAAMAAPPPAPPSPQRRAREAPAPPEVQEGEVVVCVKFVCGAVATQVAVRPGDTVGALKGKIAEQLGCPCSQQRLFCEGVPLQEEAMSLEEQGVAGGGAGAPAPVLLLRPGPSVAQRLDDALSLLEAQAARGGAAERVSWEPAAYLALGPSGYGLSSAPKRSQLQLRMAGILRAARAAVADSNTERQTLFFCPDVVELSEKTVRACLVPQLNLELARRALSSAEHCPLVAREFVGAMGAFYEDYVPQRVAAHVARCAWRDAQVALDETERAIAFASALSPMTVPPVCSGAAGVAQVASLVAAQLGRLASQGLALPALHIEHLRRAIDSAGVVLLESPPAGDPSARLAWAEAAIAMQLAPLPPLEQALADIASSVDAAGLAEALAPAEAPSAEHVRLMAAAIWIVKEDVRCDSSWKASRRLILDDPAAFVRSLAEWKPFVGSSGARLARARQLLQDVWGWAASGGCGGAALAGVMVWASLAAGMLPLVEAGQNLAPVHRELKKGLGRIQRAPKGQAAVVASKAWTSALFLLDAAGGAWWWLRLIRPSAHKEPPWTDGEDGGIAAAPHAAAGYRSEGIISVAPEAVSPPADEAIAAEEAAEAMEGDGAVEAVETGLGLAEETALAEEDAVAQAGDSAEHVPASDVGAEPDHPASAGPPAQPDAAHDSPESPP